MRRGFTLIEVLIVVALIAVVAGLLVPAVGEAMRSARQAEAERRLATLSLAAAAYAKDRGMEPPGDGRGSRGLARALAEPGGRNAPYYLPTSDELTPEGDFVNPAQGADAPPPLNAIHYRRNLGLPAGPRDGQPPVRRAAGFDLWCAGLDPARPWALRSP